MPTSPRFLTLKNIADELAISETQVYTLVRSGELPAIQVGPKKVWRIERSKFEEYIERLYAAAASAAPAELAGSEDVEAEG